MLSFISLLVWHEDIQKSRQQEPKSSAEQDKVGDNKTKDIDRIVSKGVELRVGKAEDDGEDGRGDVAEKRSPEGRDCPVLLSRENHDVEIAAQLVALDNVSIDR